MAEAFQGTHQFIYAVSFITPIFYLIWERYQDSLQHIFAGKRSFRDLKLAPPGFGWLLIWAIVVFLFTAVAYTVATSQPTPGDPTLIQSVSRDSTLYVYIFSLLCWYFIMLDSTVGGAESYREIMDQAEENQKSALHERIAKRKSDDDN